MKIIAEARVRRGKIIDCDVCQRDITTGEEYHRLLTLERGRRPMWLVAHPSCARREWPGVEAKIERQRAAARTGRHR